MAHEQNRFLHGRDVDQMSYEELTELCDQIGHVNTGLTESRIRQVTEPWNPDRSSVHNHNFNHQHQQLQGGEGATATTTNENNNNNGNSGNSSFMSGNSRNSAIPVEEDSARPSQESQQQQQPEDDQQRYSDVPACPICMELLTKQKSVAIKICNHPFHEECLIQWLKNQPRCPTCNQ